jgi:hypothetical protein
MLLLSMNLLVGEETKDAAETLGGKGDKTDGKSQDDDDEEEEEEELEDLPWEIAELVVVNSNPKTRLKKLL